MPLLSLTPRSLPCCVCRFLGDPLSDSSLPSDSGLPGSGSGSGEEEHCEDFGEDHCEEHGCHWHVDEMACEDPDCGEFDEDHCEEHGCEWHADEMACEAIECPSEQSACDADTGCSAILQAATGDSGPEPDVCNANQACAVLMACMNGSGDGPPSGSGDGDGSGDGPGDGMYTPRHARPSYSAPTYTVYSVQCTVYSVHATT
jgi:hypothetical protein